MASPWISVKVHEEKMESTVQVWGTAYIQPITARRIYQIQSLTPVTPDQLLSADDGTTHFAKPGEFFSTSQQGCVYSGSRNAQMINGSAMHWSIEAMFNDPTGFTLPSDLLALPAKITSAPMNGTEEYVKDFHDTSWWVRAASGEPFSRQPTRLSRGRIYTISKWVTATQMSLIQAVEHTNNSAAVTIRGFVCPTDSLLLHAAAFDASVALGSTTCYQAVMTIPYNPNLWTDSALNVAFTDWDSANGRAMQIMEWDDQRQVMRPVTRPWPLNMDGTKFADRTADPIKLDFYPYAQTGWGAVPVA